MLRTAFLTPPECGLADGRVLSPLEGPPMRELHRRQEKLTRSNQPGPRATSITRSVVSIALLPRRYYLLPITLEVMYFTTTVLPRWIERRHHAGSAGTGPAPVPTLVDAAVLAVLGREILRAAAHQRQRSHAGGH